ncbi:MAG: hypothetical protein DLM73_07580 [Chthoniobacterales bacterium]|nr:MAG: hypothetical protein DLM73_07580 [Chthoniobacterales bacterium]
MTLNDLEDVLRRVYLEGAAPKPLHLLPALREVRAGKLIGEAAKGVQTSAANLRRVVEASDPVAHLLGAPAADHSAKADKVRATIGQLIIGNLAERVFEDTYRRTVGSTELQLQDDRSGGGDTDYLVRNGQGRQVFRLNIKFHGSQFRKAQELVGLAPEDCFALATYKIYSALQKQEREHLPYIFVVVGVPNLTGAVVGAAIPPELIEFATMARHAPRLEGKRKVEDAIVSALTSRPADFGLSQTLDGFLEQIRNAVWRVLSARRADELLRKQLFERAYALRVRGFAMNYRGAELDMHFSISTDLHPLEDMLRILRDDGLHALSVYLERGTY